jgi:hypothetical protein
MPASYVCAPQLIRDRVTAIHIHFDLPACAYCATHANKGDAILTSTLIMAEIDVRNRRMLATSGGSGIGRTLAESFAASGAKIDVT